MTLDASRTSALDDLARRFFACERVDDYLIIRADAQRLATALSGLDSLRARLIAVDCRYWAAAAGDPRHRGSSLATLASELADIPDAVFASIADASPDVVEQWVGLVDGTARLALRDTFGDADANAAWQRLAQRMERMSPEFAFSAATWGADWRRKSVLAACGVGAISLVHGDAAHGTSRLMFALELSRQDADPIADRLNCEDVYARLGDCWRMRPEIVVSVAQVQSIIVEHLDHWRGRYRSRAGRLWVAQLFDGLLHTLQRDMAEPVLPAGAASANARAVAPLYDLLRERMFRAAESCRSRLLLDQLTWGTRPIVDARAAEAARTQERALLDMPPATRDRESTVAREAQLVSRLPMLLWQHPRQDVDAYRAKLAGVHALEELFVRHDAGLGASEPVASLEDVMDSLQDREVIIEYAIPRDTLHPAPAIVILAITRTGVRHVIQDLEGLKTFPWLFHGDIGSLAIGGREPLEVSPLGELVFQTRLAIQHGDEADARIRLRLLHQLLIEPLAIIDIHLRDFDCLHVVPNAVLHAVPFGALLDASDAFVGSQVATCVTPSVSVWLSLRRPWRPEPVRFIGFGNPRLDAAQGIPLPKTEVELRAAARIVGDSEAGIYVQDAATLDAFARYASDETILHVASHGDFPESNVVDLHQLMLTPGSDDNGRLTAERVREVNLRKAQLVVLSVCNGGVYRVGPGDELYGLVPAVLEAGAGTVVTTLWPIDDAMARLWMREFYKTVVAHGPAQAAKGACETLIGDGMRLRDWAGFVVVGSAQPDDVALADARLA